MIHENKWLTLTMELYVNVPAIVRFGPYLGPNNKRLNQSSYLNLIDRLFR